MTLLKQNSAVEQGDDEIDLSEIFNILRESWKLIALVAVGALLLGTMYAVLATPVYRADAVIQVDDDSGLSSINSKLSDLASLFQSTATVDAEIELIRSRLVVGETVNRLHLDVFAQPDYFPLIGGAIARYRQDNGLIGLANPVIGLSSFAWGGELIDISRFDVPPVLYETKFKLRVLDAQGYELVDPDGNVTLRGHVNEDASGATSNGIVHLKVASLMARPGTSFQLKRFSTQQTVDEMQKKLDIAEKTKQSGIIGVKLDGHDAQRVTATINMIASLYVQHNVDGKSAQAQQMLSFLGEQLPKMRADLDQSEARYNEYRSKSGAVDLDAQAKLLLQSVVDTKSHLVELQQQRADLVQRYTPSHPAVLAVDARIAELEHQQDQYDGLVNGVPQTQQEVLRLMRDVKVNTDLYMKLLDSTEQLRVLKAGQLGNVRTVDFAVVPEQPVRPKKVIVTALALVLGLVLGCVVALGRRALNRGLESPAEIELAIDVPVRAIISRSEKQAELERSVRRNPSWRRGVLAAIFPDDAAIEGLRSLRTALQFGLIKPDNNVLMITGPRAEVGKSFVSVNLATVIATAGKRVLLIDADMRRGNVHSYFSFRNTPGLSEVLSGRPFAEVIHHQVVPNLDVMTAGAYPDRPSELLIQGRFGTMCKTISAMYDLVIVDSPPILAVTDPVVVGKEAGATLMVIRHGRHSAAELREATRHLASAGVSLNGVLLTDVPRRGSTYGAYSEYRTKTS
ncbi:polysaccharide biosynthesis tyrosine autokinase [Paraburkholderia terrae]